MTLPKFLMLTFLLCGLLACKQTLNHSDNLNKIKTTKNDTTESIIIDSATSTKKANNSLNNEDIEGKIIDTIFKLTEVKERAKYIEEQTKGKRHLKVWVAGTPNLPNQKYYWIKVGEDNGANLVTIFNFYVYPDSLRIMYYDTHSDTELTLNKWKR